MKPVLFTFPDSDALAENISVKINTAAGKFILRKFPDGETYIRVESDVKNKNVIIVCSLNNPDEKIIPIYFLTKTLKSLHAKTITLIAPYLSYMRQDTIFQRGEGVTSTYFASLISSCVDSLITVDPHLHRTKNLSDIYSIPCKVIHSSEKISQYIRTSIKNPVLIGPDEESKQWVKDVAGLADAPFTILKKIRLGDDQVKVSVPHLEKYKNHTPVLVDDIISTGKTMIETIYHLQDAGMSAPVCIGVHAIFANNAYEELKKAGASQIITCNTIKHESNKIDISTIISDALNKFISYEYE